jgi:hypothetical protein
MAMTVYTGAVRDALVELADAEYQQRVWTGESAEGEMSSLVENVERLFTDSGLGDALERTHPVYGSQVDDEFRRLDRLVSRIDGARSPDEILRDPLLAEVRQLASEILRAFDQRGRSGDILHAASRDSARPARTPDQRS